MSEEEQIILPERFKRIDYLFFDKNQYINTGVYVSNSIGTKLKYTRTFPFGSGEYYAKNLLGCRPDANGNPNCWVPPNALGSDGTFYCHYGTANSYKPNPDRKLELGKVYEVEHNFKNCSKSFINGEFFVEFDREQFTEDNYTKFPLHLGAFVLDNGVYHMYNWYGKCYYCIITDGEDYIRHFIPVYDTYKLEACMYELVEGKAYYNNGTGYFGLGNDNEQLGILHKLPEGFTKVNYLIANGSQYIDTNYVPTNETGYYLEGQGYTSDTSYFFGCNETSNWGDNKRIYCCATPNVIWGWMTYGTLTNNAAYLRQENKISFNFLNDRKATATINDTNFSYTLPSLNFTPTRNLHLFDVNLSGTTGAPLKGRIDTFLISEGVQIVRQFVPCLDADGIPCMYELYTGTVHYNQGAGQFSYPREYTNDPINLPAGYTKCAYLQSDGTQWIDTGHIPTDETGLYIKAQRLNYGDFVPFGARTSDSVYVQAPRWNTSSKYMVYSWNTYSAPFQYDKGDDLIYSSSLNLYNDRTIRMNSEDTKWVGLLSSTLGTMSYSLWLFSYNYQGAYNATLGNWGGRIYRAQITQGTDLIHDFVPCLDANGRPCMYDIVGGGTVEDNTYYNQSGGVEFTYCVEHQLPSDFSKLKYLESTGTQFIKTGYVPTNNTGLYIDAYHTKYNGNTNGCTIGLRNTNGNTYFFAPRVQRDTNGAGFGWGAFTTPGGNGNCRYEGSLNFLNDRKAIITAPAFAQRINALETLSFTPTKDLYMFGMNNYDGAATSYSTYRIYRAKISEGSEIVRDFVPAYDNRRDKTCMYDLINNVAYYNDGTGEFLTNRDFEGTYTGFTGLGCIGNRLGYDYCTLPSGYTNVEFLESNGTQYIQCDIPMTKETGIYIRFKQTSNATWMYNWGFAGGADGGYIVIGIDGPGLPVSAGKLLNHAELPYSDADIYEAYVNYKNDGKYRLESNGITSVVNGGMTRTSNFTGLFGLVNEPGTKFLPSARAKIYIAHFTHDDVIVCEMLPCLDNNGIPCMYDTVTDRPFYNNGTGQFIVGMKTLSQAISLRLPETGGTLQLSLPTNDNVEYYEEKIRANNPSWNFTFSYH